MGQADLTTEMRLRPGPGLILWEIEEQENSTLSVFKNILLQQLCQLCGLTCLYFHYLLLFLI